MSQTPEGSAPSAPSPHTHTPLGAAQALFSYLGQGSPSDLSKPTAVLDTAAHDVMSRVDKASESSTSAVAGATQNVMSRVDKASESSTSAVAGAAQNVMSGLDKASESSTSAVVGAAQNVMSRLDKASESSTSTVMGAAQNMMSRMDNLKPSESSTSTVMGAAQSLLSRLEKPSEASTSAAVMGAAQNVLSRIVLPSAHHQASSTLASHALPELPQEHSAEASAPADAPQQRAAEPGAPAPTSTSTHGGAGGRALTPPRGASRRDSRLHRSYPTIPEAAHQRPIPVPYGTAYRRSTGPYPDIYDSEAAWHVAEDRDPHRPKTVGERLEETIESATTERDQATDRAKTTNLMQNAALALQVLMGALTTALGAALSGKNTSVAISILGGGSTLIASYLARMKGTNEPQTSQRRAQQLEHFVREVKAFMLDHGHEVGDKWDDKINGFRLGLEKILGNQPGSMAIGPDGTFNPNQEKGVGVMGPNMGLSGNGPYGVSTMNGKTGAFGV